MLYLYYIERCPYCIEARKQMKQLNIKYKETLVPSDKKEIYKKKHKMQTFPQFLWKNDDKKCLLGGSEVLGVIRALDMLKPEASPTGIKGLIDVILKHSVVKH